MSLLHLLAFLLIIGTLTDAPESFSSATTTAHLWGKARDWDHQTPSPPPVWEATTTMQRNSRAWWSWILMSPQWQRAVHSENPQLTPLTTDSCLANAGLNNHAAYKKGQWKTIYPSRDQDIVLSWWVGSMYAVFLKILQQPSMERRLWISLDRACVSSLPPHGDLCSTCTVAHSIRSSWLDDSKSFSQWRTEGEKAFWKEC